MAILFNIFSVATIWYGLITSNSSSLVNTQYLVNIFNNVCLVKKVLAKSIKSVIPLFFWSAQYEVNSNELDFFFFWLLIWNSLVVFE